MQGWIYCICRDPKQIYEAECRLYLLQYVGAVFIKSSQIYRIRLIEILYCTASYVSVAAYKVLSIFIKLLGQLALLGGKGRCQSLQPKYPRNPAAWPLSSSITRSVICLSWAAALSRVPLSTGEREIEIPGVETFRRLSAAA